MAASVKFICFLGLLAVVLNIAGLDAAGECGKSSPDNEAMKLAPCATAAQDEKAPASGIKPQIAMTIPKRCNIANRPVGYKCGPYTLHF
ncbi:hypothetical protein Patl1_31766 [Pistacia atlantica]|uniref:Uncharacterized protein n=1 Tax=Pistacia atlantica TaxID=434234 RepID=A0ACC1ANG0_9ROSI|nr:hypothetical protein Patl1_31766 [Pistacia atlantica]